MEDAVAVLVARVADLWRCSVAENQPTSVRSLHAVGTEKGRKGKSRFRLHPACRYYTLLRFRCVCEMTIYWPVDLDIYFQIRQLGRALQHVTVQQWYKMRSVHKCISGLGRCGFLFRSKSLSSPFSPLKLAIISPSSLSRSIDSKIQTQTCSCISHNGPSSHCYTAPISQ